jgi:hypothetical protein
MNAMKKGDMEKAKMWLDKLLIRSDE